MRMYDASTHHRWRGPLIPLVLVAALAPAAARGQTSDPLFPSPLYAVGDPFAPTMLARADLDGDRWPDLIVSNGVGSSAISVVRGAGPAVFAQEVQFAAGPQPMTLALADFDRDGHTDVACGHNAQPVVNVFFGDGLGGFPVRLDIPAPISCQAVAAGDLNHDGNPDLVIGMIGRSSIQVFFGDGLGGFAPGGSFPAAFSGGPKVTLVIAELTGDAHPDVLFARGQGACFLFTGDGLGAFAAAIALPGSTGSYDVTVADLDRDGDLDVATALNAPAAMGVHLNPGNGNFGTPLLLPTSLGAQWVEATDLDLDGALDLVGSCSDIQFLVAWYGDGAGNFTRARLLPGGRNPCDLAAADWNADGRADVALAVRYDSGVGLLLGDARGDTGGRAWFTGTTPSFIASADLDQDGRPDLAVADRGSDDVALLRGLPGGEFAPAIVLPVPSMPVALALADLDHDTLPDLVVAHEPLGLVSVWLGDGTGGMTSAANYASGALPRSVVLSDFDHDGELDLAVACAGTAVLEVRRGTGAGAFGPSVSLPVGAGSGFVLAPDVDGDGHPDLVTTNQGGSTLSILIGDGLGGFAAPSVVPTCTQPRWLVAADLDQDTLLDLVVAGATSSGRIVWHKGLGAGAFGPQTTVLTNVNAIQSIGVADFDDDGVLDIAGIEAVSNLVDIVTATSPGVFGAAQRYLTLANPLALAVVDVDLDQRADLVVASSAAGSVHVLPRYLRDCNGDGLADPLQIQSGALTDCNLNGVPDACDVQLGTSPDADANGTPDECQAMAGTAFCAGDGSAAPCPCGNTSPAGSGTGCLHSFGLGARLTATGEARLGADSLTLHLSDTPPSTVAFYLQGTTPNAGGQGTPFGDGLLCLDGTLLRLGSRSSIGGASMLPAPGGTPLSLRGQIPPGGATRHYLGWYRNNASFCTPAAFNTSNGLTLLWSP